jgi:hypothetical protein
MQTLLAGHALLFFDCSEIAQGGPVACSLSLDGSPVRGWRFDPSPLEYEGAILVPVRKWGFLRSGYALARIDVSTRRVSIVSGIYGYMRLLHLEGRSVVFATTTYGPDTDSISLA